MANYSPAFNTDSELGGVNTVFTPDPLSGYDNPPNGVGTERVGTDGSVWNYVKAATTINQGDCVHLDQNSNASQMTAALAASGVGLVGFCQVSGGIPQGSFGWVATFGNALSINVAAATAAGVALYTSATPGVLGSVATGQNQVFGVKTTVANGGGATALEPAIATSPRTVN